MGECSLLRTRASHSASFFRDGIWSFSCACGDSFPLTLHNVKKIAQSITLMNRYCAVGKLLAYIIDSNKVKGLETRKIRV
jgi:hypothetical protein